MLEIQREPGIQNSLQSVREIMGPASVMRSDVERNLGESKDMNER